MNENQLKIVLTDNLFDAYKNYNLKKGENRRFYFVSLPDEHRSEWNFYSSWYFYSKVSTCIFCLKKKWEEYRISLICSMAGTYYKAI